MNGNVDNSPWNTQKQADAALRVHLLGCVELDALLTLQEVLAEEIMGRIDRTGYLLLCEHPPEVTVGRNGSAATFLWKSGPKSPDARWLARGGGAWNLGPGRIAVYAILPLERLGIGLSDYRAKMCQSFANVGQDLKLDATVAHEIPGAMTHVGQYAFMGGAVRSGVSLFGGCLLVSVTSDKIPAALWGTKAAPLGSMRQRPGLMSSIRMALVRHLSAEFGYSVSHVLTGHPQLRRSSQPTREQLSPVSQPVVDDTMWD